jgi:hypothetical protein
VPDPGSLFADGGKNWEASRGRQRRRRGLFVARVQNNAATFAASMVAPPAGKWSFQLVSYATVTDARADPTYLSAIPGWKPNVSET